MPKTVKRVVMAKTVAGRWLSRCAHAEYRLRVLYGAHEFKNLPNFLRAFRDSRVAVQGLMPLPDLGIKEEFDAVEVWSSDRDALARLKDWFEKRNMETSGVW